MAYFVSTSRFVRLILYGIFGFVGVVGAGLALSKGDVANAGVNGLFFVGAGGAYFVDLKVQGALLRFQRDLHMTRCLASKWQLTPI